MEHTSNTNDKQDNKKKEQRKNIPGQIDPIQYSQKVPQHAQQSTYIIINKSDNTAGMVQIWSVWFPLTTLDTS